MWNVSASIVNAGPLKGVDYQSMPLLCIGVFWFYRFPTCNWISKEVRFRVDSNDSSPIIYAYLASSPGGRNDHLVHTVMRMRLISEESWKIVYSCPHLQNGGTEGNLN